MGLRNLFQTLNSVGISPDSLLGSLTVGQVDQLLARLESPGDDHRRPGHPYVSGRGPAGEAAGDSQPADPADPGAAATVPGRISLHP